MIRRITIITATAVLLVAALQGSASAEYDENEAIEGQLEDVSEGEGEGEHGGEQIGLPFESINWTNFSYQDPESEEHYAEYGVQHAGPPVVAVLLNFVLLAFIIYLLARKPLSAYLQSRSDNVREGLAEAKKLLEEANERLADYSSKLERMDEEMTRLKEEFIAAGETERDRLIADAGAKAERMRRDTEVRLQQEFAQLREELRVEAIEKAVAAATGALKEQVKEVDQRRLADEYLSQVEQEGLGR